MDKNYEPPTIAAGTPLALGHEPEIFPGVHGIAIAWAGEIRIPLIYAATPGSGAVSKFLDAISPRCVIVNVVSPKLRDMLRDRGFSVQWSEHEGEAVDEWRKAA